MKEIYEKYLSEKVNFDDEYKEEFADALNDALFSWGKIPQYDNVPSILSVFGKKFEKEYPELKELAKLHKVFEASQEKIRIVLNKLYKKL